MWTWLVGFAAFIYIIEHIKPIVVSKKTARTIVKGAKVTWILGLIGVIAAAVFGIFVIIKFILPWLAILF